jgi:hypothetical protein
MAKCEDCQREMKLAPSCIALPMLIAGRPYQRIPNAASAHGRCDGCGVKPGGIHHMGCDLERCPRCNGQLIMCECSEAEAS